MNGGQHKPNPNFVYNEQNMHNFHALHHDTHTHTPLNNNDIAIVTCPIALFVSAPSNRQHGCQSNRKSIQQIK